MAGDWIKLESATLEKPEVALFAELLGVPVDQGLGLLVRFWVWLDRNCGNGRVTHVSRRSIETVMHTPGFAAALEAVGWIVFDDEGRTFTVPNFDRHNGKPAKTRALGKDRVAAHRAKSANDSVTPNALPEKRREEVKTKTSIHTRSDPKPAETLLPADFVVSERVARWAKEKGHARLDEHLEAFVRRARMKGYRYVNWDDAFMEAIRTDWAGLNKAQPPPRVNGSHREPTRADKRAGTIDDLIEGRPNERTLEGRAERVSETAVPALPGDLRQQGGDDVRRRGSG